MKTKVWLNLDPQKVDVNYLYKKFEEMGCDFEAEAIPDNDPEYKGISSIELLKRTAEIIKEKGYRIVNIDATIIAQRPRLRDHIDEMIENIAGALSVRKDDVNVKATTEEGLGFTGEGLGISAFAVCLIDSIEEDI